MIDLSTTFWRNKLLDIGKTITDPLASRIETSEIESLCSLAVVYAQYQIIGTADSTPHANDSNVILTTGILHDPRTVERQGRWLSFVLVLVKSPGLLSCQQVSQVEDFLQKYFSRHLA